MTVGATCSDGGDPGAQCVDYDPADSGTPSNSGGWSCTCSEGYADEGGVCVEQGPCAGPAPKASCGGADGTRGTCVNLSPESYSCNCNAPYVPVATAEGLACMEDKEEYLYGDANARARTRREFDSLLAQVDDAGTCPYLVGMKVQHKGGNADQPYFTGSVDFSWFQDTWQKEVIEGQTDFPTYCVDVGHSIGSNHGYCARLMSTYADWTAPEYAKFTGPGKLQHPEYLGAANFVLNNYRPGEMLTGPCAALFPLGYKIQGGTVQRIMWSLVYYGQTNFKTNGGWSEGPWNALAGQCMLDEALKVKDTYEPPCDGVAGVIAYPVGCSCAGAGGVPRVETAASKKECPAAGGVGGRTYSSVWDNNACGVNHGRSTLNSAQAWSANRNVPGDHWMQIDLGAVDNVLFVVTQGRNNYDQWVTYFKLSTSTDGSTWTNIAGPETGGKFKANANRNHLVRNDLPAGVTARYVRFTATDWHSHPSMRAGVSVAEYTDAAPWVEPTATTDSNDPVAQIQISTFPMGGCKWLDAAPSAAPSMLALAALVLARLA